MTTDLPKCVRPGAALGHHGMESIIRLIGSPDFPRIQWHRRPSNHEAGDAIDHVLGRFYPDEKVVRRLFPASPRPS